MKIKLLLTGLAVLSITGLSAQDKKSPSFEEVISLRSVSNPLISPDGNNVLFQRSSVDWKKNRYDREIWISYEGQEAIQLTNNPDGSCWSPQWSPDGKWIAFVSYRSDDTHIYAIRPQGGEAFQISDTENNPFDIKWSPDGKKISFRMQKDNSEVQKTRKEKYGAYAVEDNEYQLNQLWIMDFEEARLGYFPLPDQMEDSIYKANLKPELLMDSVDFTISSYEWSPDGNKIAFNHQPDPLINSFFKSGISVYDLSSETWSVLVDNPSYDGFLAWSPDGRSIIYETNLSDTTSNFYVNSKYFIIGLDGSKNRQVAGDFDENINRVKWNEKGIFGLAWQKTNRVLLQIEPGNGKTSVLQTSLNRIYSYDFSRDHNKIVFSGAGNTELGEIYLSKYPIKTPSQLTNVSKQIKNWLVAQSEVISWKSNDGSIIEGVLSKPEDYNPDKKYPLMIIIHGGPTGISTPGPVKSYVYPTLQWLNKGALILYPNYRGSAGYGEKFRSLNVKNLGVGDAWDVLSGAQKLIDDGMVDPNKMGAMGWSQGGYISAFLSTNSDKFRAISVGAGISNWMTYYVNTDIHPFTRQYLKATPWSDKEIYEKTSPMTNINQASTPTLIQHGEFDKRVPPANAFELYQGLQDIGVDTKLIIYKGFGHGISKPKERLVANWHNWQWFAKYIWGEDIELPMK